MVIYLEAIGDLDSRGYSKSFVYKQNALLCIETNEAFIATNVSIIEYHRFEGATDYEDMAIIYVIETNNGTKGTITDAFGTYASTELGNFLQQVHFKDK